MILYKNKRRGRRSVIGGTSKLGGIATIQVREMNDPELYPHGPHMQFNFGENRELSLEISYHDAIELKAKIEDFLRTAEKAYIERLNAGRTGPIGKIPDATLCARCGAQYKHHGLVGRNCPTGIPSSRWSKETFVLPKPITICHPGQAENEGQ